MQEKKDLHAKLALCYELYWAKNKQSSSSSRRKKFPLMTFHVHKDQNITLMHYSLC